MKKTAVFLLIFVLSLLIIILSHNVSHAGYLLKLKNGRTIVVSDYKDTGKQIRFYYQGGEMTISKQTVEDIKHVELKRTWSLMYEYEEESIETAPDTEVGTTRSRDENKANFPDLIEELSNLYRQKEALAKEREKLIKKQEEFLKEIRQEGRRVLPTKKKEFKRQSDALEEEIKRFNEKVAGIEKREKSVKSKIESFDNEKKSER